MIVTYAVQEPAHSNGITLCRNNVGRPWCALSATLCVRCPVPQKHAVMPSREGSRNTVMGNRNRSCWYFRTERHYWRGCPHSSSYGTDDIRCIQQTSRAVSVVTWDSALWNVESPRLCSWSLIHRVLYSWRDEDNRAKDNRMDRIFSTKWRDVNCVQNFVCKSTGITVEGRNIDDWIRQHWRLNRHGCPTFVCNVATKLTKANVKKLPVR